MAADLTLDVVTIFPDYLAPLRQSLLGKAIERGQVDVRVHDLRRWTDDVHRTVDDTPYGGGPGMVMKPEPIFQAAEAALVDGVAMNLGGGTHHAFADERLLRIAGAQKNLEVKWC